MWGSPVLFFSQGIVGLWFAAHDCFTAELNYVRLRLLLEVWLATRRSRPCK